MLYQAGNLTLTATDAELGINKYRVHINSSSNHKAFVMPLFKHKQSPLIDGDSIKNKQ
jgi:isopentenyldiphosphate isomerase